MENMEINNIQEQNGYSEVNYNEKQLEQPTNDWRNALPEEMRGSQTLSKFDSIEALAKAYSEQSSLIGKKVEAFSESDWKKFSEIQSSINDIPKSAEEYAIDTRPYEDGQGNVLTDEDVKFAKALSHELGLNKNQAQLLCDRINESLGGILQERQEEANRYVEENMKILEEQWGKAGEQKIAAMGNCIESVLPTLTGKPSEYWYEKIEQSGMHMDADFCNLMASLGEMTSESRSVGYSKLAPMDASQKLDQMKADKEIMSIINNSHHPRNRELSNEFRTLIQIKNGER